MRTKRQRKQRRQARKLERKRKQEFQTEYAQLAIDRIEENLIRKRHDALNDQLAFLDSLILN